MTDFGTEFRKARQAHNLGLRGCAQRLYMSYPQLSKIENGRRNPPPELPAQADKLFDTGTKFQELIKAESAVDAPGDASDEIYQFRRDVDGKAAFMATSRRRFLEGIGAIVVSGATAPAVKAAPPAGGAEMHPVSRFKHVRRVLIDNDNVFGPVEVIPKVEEQIRVIQGLKQQMEGTDRLGLIEMQTQFAEFNGWLYQDLGDHATAQFWMDRAHQWAHTTGDQDLLVFIMARKAQLAADMRDAAETIDAATGAAYTARPQTRLAAVANTYGAHGYALAGDRLNCERSYDSAQTTLHGLGEETSPWGVWLDDSYIQVHRARSLAALGDYAAAIDEYADALSTAPDGYHRDHGVYLARAAMAHAGDHDAQQAAEVGTQALSIAIETGSGRIITELVDLDNALAPAGNTARVAAFRDAMRDTVLRQT